MFLKLILKLLAQIEFGKNRYPPKAIKKIKKYIKILKNNVFPTFPIALSFCKQANEFIPKLARMQREKSIGKINLDGVRPDNRGIFDFSSKAETGVLKIRMELAININSQNFLSLWEENNNPKIMKKIDVVPI